MTSMVQLSFSIAETVPALHPRGEKRGGGNLHRAADQPAEPARGSSQLLTSVLAASNASSADVALVNAMASSATLSAVPGSTLAVSSHIVATPTASLGVEHVQPVHSTDSRQTAKANGDSLSAASIKSARSSRAGASTSNRSLADAVGEALAQGGGLEGDDAAAVIARVSAAAAEAAAKQISFESRGSKESKVSSSSPSRKSFKGSNNKTKQSGGGGGGVSKEPLEPEKPLSRWDKGLNVLVVDDSAPNRKVRV